MPQQRFVGVGGFQMLRGATCCSLRPVSLSVSLGRPRVSPPSGCCAPEWNPHSGGGGDKRDRKWRDRWMAQRMAADGQTLSRFSFALFPPSWFSPPCTFRCWGFFLCWGLPREWRPTAWLAQCLPFFCSFGPGSPVLFGCL